MKYEFGGRRLRWTLGWGLVLIAALVLVPAATAWAEEDHDQAAWEIKLVQKKIHQLMREAEELREAGHAEEAAEHAARAQVLRERLAVYFAQREGAAKPKAGKKKAKPEKTKGKKAGKGKQDPKKILKGLESGIAALKALGGHEEAVAHLHRIAEGLRARMRGAKPKERGAKTERQMAEHQLELLHMAHGVLREAHRGDAAEIAEHAAHALELRLAGRRDEEARHIYETAPKREAVIRVLGMAAEILAVQGKKDRAHWLIEHIRQMKGGRKKVAAKPRPKRDRDAAPRRKERGERGQVIREIEVLELALPVLREEGRERTIEIVERAMHARRLMISGRRDDEAREIIADQPPPAHIAEIMLYAGNLWRKYKNVEKAKLCEGLGRRYQEIATRQRDRPKHEGEHRERERREGEHRERPDMERLEALQRQLNELGEALRRIQGELEAYARRR